MDLLTDLWKKEAKLKKGEEEVIEVIRSKMLNSGVDARKILSDI